MNILSLFLLHNLKYNRKSLSYWWPGLPVIDRPGIIHQLTKNNIIDKICLLHKYFLISMFNSFWVKILIVLHKCVIYVFFQDYHSCPDIHSSAAASDPDILSPVNNKEGI